MALKKAHEVDAWLARPDRDAVVVLLYGPDRGLVAERARTFAAALGLPLEDPFTVIRLDGSDCEKNPGRLIEEASTIPMFADRRLVWVDGAGAQKRFADEVKALCDAPPAAAIVLIEAGDLKKGAPLRAAAESAAQAMALPCYADNDRDLDGVIDQELQKSGLRIEADARQLLRRSLGGDRLASRRELEKLALYAQGEQRVTVAHVADIIGDASGLSTDDVVDAVLGGQVERMDTLFARQIKAGNAATPIVAAAQRQFSALHLMRATMRLKDRNAAAVVAAGRPPVFYARKTLVEQVLARMPETFFETALRKLEDAVLAMRVNSPLATTTARSVLLGLCIEIARARR